MVGPAPIHEAWSQWQPEEGDYAFIDLALHSSERREVKLALRQVRMQKAEYARIRAGASDTIDAIHAHEASQTASRGSKRARRSTGKTAETYRAALRDANHKSMAAMLRQSIDQQKQAASLIHAADVVIRQLQRHLIEIGPG